MTISIETCVRSLNAAAMSRKAAFQTELAVGFAVFLTQGTTDLTAKRLLTDAYAAAGYMCADTTDADYKTVNRRVNVCADLFNTIKLKAVKQWAGKTDDDQLIAAMVEGLRPYELYNVSDVQRYVESKAPPVQAGVAKKAAPAVVQPHTDILTGPNAGGDNNTGQEKVTGMFRRAADEVAKGADHIETEHLAVMIPKAATPDEMIELAQKLLALAQERKQQAAEALPV